MAEFPSVNWAVSLSRWSHLPGIHSHCCKEGAEDLTVFCLFLLSSSFFLLFLTILLSFSLGAGNVEAALGRMIDRCQTGAQGSARASVDELADILGLTDRQAAVTICGLYYFKVVEVFVHVCLRFSLMVSSLHIRSVFQSVSYMKTMGLQRTAVMKVTQSDNSSYYMMLNCFPYDSKIFIMQIYIALVVRRLLTNSHSWQLLNNKFNKYSMVLLSCLIR